MFFKPNLGATGIVYDFVFFWMLLIILSRLTRSNFLIAFKKKNIHNAVRAKIIKMVTEIDGMSSLIV